MSENGQQFDPRVKIAKENTKGKVIDFTDWIEPKVSEKTDVLDYGKVIANFVEFDPQTNKAKPNGKFSYYISVDDAVVIFSDILNMRFRKDPKDQDGKAYLPISELQGGGQGKSSGHAEWEWAGRKLQVRYRTHMQDGAVINKGPVVDFAFQLFEATKADSGLYPPKQGGTRFSGLISLDIATARRVAAAVLSHISAKMAAYQTIEAFAAVRSQRQAA